MSTAFQHLIAVDWGTTSLRGALLNADGRVLQERSAPSGILSVAPGQFPLVFADLFGDWMQAPQTLCLMAGMVGSQQGWTLAPYCACPAGFADIAAHLCWLQDVGAQRIAIVPGLSCQHPGLRGDATLAHIPDVMRGEEIQVFGALRVLGLSAARLVLPGTHSKWVQVQQGRITGFATYMTGECYALLRQHSILARSLAQVDDLDTGAAGDAAFEQGVRIALRGPSLLHSAFSLRTLSLFERLPLHARTSYLSGLLIGEELRAQDFVAVEVERQTDTEHELARPTEPIVIIGSAMLTQRYQRALALCGIAAQGLGAEATWAGLAAIARSITP